MEPITKGTRNGQSRYSEVQIMAILMDKGDFETIAKAYNASKALISSIKSGRSRQHITRGITDQRNYGRKKIDNEQFKSIRE